jgi:molybdopterin molybdotransferase
MISLEEARELLQKCLPPPKTERISLAEALGRYAAENLASPIDLPRFDNSAMDGYAVRSDDLRGASELKPLALRLAGRTTAGEGRPLAVAQGTCIRIFTGSPMPAAANAVVMQEDITIDGDSIRFIEAVKPLENVRLRGEDVRAGALLARAGEAINAARAGLLAAAGFTDLPLYRAPSIGLIATGTELREPGEQLGAGEIFESNRTLLAGLLRRINCSPRIFPLVPDDLGATVTALRGAFELCDVVISTGGVSVGELDFVKAAFQQLGGAIDLWKIAMRPGKPFVFGRLGEKLLFGLPGNPVSALVTFLVLVRPALLQMQGAGAIGLPRMPGELTGPVSNRGDRRHFIRICWAAGKIRVAGPQASHMIGSLGEANGLIDLPAGISLVAGTPVEALLWEFPES